MVALDCKSFDSALETSAAILSMPSSQLRGTLQEYYGSLSESERDKALCIDSLVDYCFCVSPDLLPSPRLTHWFHATRVVPGTEFGEGILPLSAMLEQTWSFLGDLASDWSTRGEWIGFRGTMKGEGANQYHHRLTSADEGPYAFLVRETIFLSDRLGNWDYLRTPETIHDICRSYRKMFPDRDLHRRFLDATRPCIVKFRSTSEPDDLLFALSYLFTVLAGDEIGRESLHCYCGRGRLVEPAEVLSIEWL